MSSLTLGTLYDDRDKARLNATQMISLHLLLHRPKADQDSVDPMFGPYISTLPRDFDSHPLTWRIKSHHAGQASVESMSLGCIPPTVMTELAEIEKRFWTDFQAILDFMVSVLLLFLLYTHHLQRRNPQKAAVQGPFEVTESSRLARFSLVMDYLWAWLNGHYNSFLTTTGLSDDRKFSEYAVHILSCAAVARRFR